jgi:hypothetical protein
VRLILCKQSVERSRAKGPSGPFCALPSQPKLTQYAGRVRRLGTCWTISLSGLMATELPPGGTLPEKEFGHHEKVSEVEPPSNEHAVNPDVL